MINIQKLQFSEQTVTNFKEVVNRNVPFVSWGVDNLFVEELYLLLDASPIHYSALKARVDNSVGAGYINDYQINSKQSLNDVAKQIWFEFYVTGNLFLEIIWKNNRAEGIEGFHVIPSKYMRVHKPDEPGLPATKYLYSRDWAQWRRGQKLIEFHEFNPKDFQNRQIVHIKNYGPGYEYYGTPSYMAVLNDVKLNHEITVYNLANLINGANPSLWVHFNQPAPDSEFEQTNTLKQIEDRYRGSNNAGRVIVSYGDLEEKPEITQIQSNLQQGFYSEVFELVQHQILAGHGIPDASIIGLPQKTGFSSSADQLETAYKLFMRNSIIPAQQFMNRELKSVIELIYPGQEINLEIQNTSLF
jgi:phage portal protein BeeE